MAELSVNMLARLYPTVAIGAPRELRGALVELAASINPRIRIQEDSPPRTTLTLGQHTEAGIGISASGWLARVGGQPADSRGATNAYGAAAAAALGVGALFRRVFLDAPTERDFILSLLDYGSAPATDSQPPPVNIGEVVFAGVGAVGNAGLWVLARHAGLVASIQCVDAEVLELSNLQRYVLGMAADVGRPKVEIAQALFWSSKVSFTPSRMTLEEFAAARGAEWKTICVSVDNVETRRSAQALLPQIVINGWTGDRSLGASWHIFDREAACLACLYHPRQVGASATEQAARALGLTNERAALLWVTQEPLAEEDLAHAANSLGVESRVLEPWRGKHLGDLYTDVVCGAVPLDVAGVGRLESVPLAHQSVLAGVMMAAELVKRSDPELFDRSQDAPLVTYEDILAAPPCLWTRPRPREAGCICTDADYQGRYAQKWRDQFGASSQTP